MWSKPSSSVAVPKRRTAAGSPPSSICGYTTPTGITMSTLPTLKVRAMKRILTTIAVVALAGSVSAACKSNSSNKSASNTTTTAVAGTTLTLVATNFQFDKTALSATAGQPVTLVIKNEGTVPHNLT